MVASLFDEGAWDEMSMPHRVVAPCGVRPLTKFEYFVQVSDLQGLKGIIYSILQDIYRYCVVMIV